MIQSIVKRMFSVLGYEIRRMTPRKKFVERQSEDECSDNWTAPFQVLSTKWVEVPTSRSGRKKTSELLRLSDRELLHEWKSSRHDISTGEQFAHRGWYHTLYSEIVAGKKILDVGSGFAIDSLTFAQHGAKLTFIDLARDNLGVVERLAGMLGLHGCRFVCLESIDSLHDLDTDYDIIMAMGSLHHAPTEVIVPEVAELRKHLKVGGRWLQLAYPKTRWVREGCLPFSEWGNVTDGPGTPWAEWCDLAKFFQVHHPADFDVVLNV